MVLYILNIYENFNCIWYLNCGYGILEGYGSSDRLWLERGLWFYIWYKNINRLFKFLVVFF